MALISNGTTVASGGKVQGSGESLTRGPLLANNTLGSYGMCALVPNSTQSPGYTVSSSNLRFTNAQANGLNTSAGGTWRLMGTTSGDSNIASTSIWIRIS